MKIMTFNLRCVVAGDGDNNWPYRLQSAVAMIQKHHPDFLGTQEVTDTMAEDLKEPLADYEALGDGRNRDRRGERCTLYVARDRWTVHHSETLWLSETPEVPGSADPEEGFPRICTMVVAENRADHRRYLVLNVHLAYLSARAKAQNAHTLVMLIARWKASYHLPVILMGDFNAEPDEAVHHDLRQAGLISGLDAMQVPHLNTFHAFLGGAGEACIDYIYVTPELRFVSWQVDQSRMLNRYPSDHYPVIAEIRRADR